MVYDELNVVSFHLKSEEICLIANVAIFTVYNGG